MLEAYLYDAGGNQSQYHYDSFERLQQIQLNGTTSGEYRYDHQGRRIQKTEGSTTSNYLYDGQNLYAEYPSTSWATPTAQYVQAGLDRPLARLTGNIHLPTATAAYYHQDGIGSVLAMTNAAKAITTTQRFDAFGQKIQSTGSTLKQLEEKMYRHAKNLEFEEAAHVRDQIKLLQAEMVV